MRDTNGRNTNAARGVSRRQLLGGVGGLAVFGTAGCMGGGGDGGGGGGTTTGGTTAGGSGGTATSGGGGGGGATESGSGGGGGGKATTVAATLADYEIKLSKTTVPAGSVEFNIANDAEQVHEFVVFATDLAEDKLPTKDGGNEVNEDAASLTLVDEVEDIEGGTKTTLSLDLDPGHYVAVCNIPGHYKLGMHAGFTVK